MAGKRFSFLGCHLSTDAKCSFKEGFSSPKNAATVDGGPIRETPVEVSSFKRPAPFPPHWPCFNQEIAGLIKGLWSPPWSLTIRPYFLGGGIGEVPLDSHVWAQYLIVYPIGPVLITPLKPNMPPGKLYSVWKTSLSLWTGFFFRGHSFVFGGATKICLLKR